MKKRLLVSIVLIALLIIPASAVYSGFGLNLGLTYDRDTEEDESLVGISFKPDMEFGNWGIGLDATFNFILGGDDLISFRTRDWVPEFEGDTFLEHTQEVFGLYLPLIRYVRYGHKGDELYGRAGTIDAYTLGTGVFFDRYSNTRLMPDRRLVGAVLDIDGNLFNFPYVGSEMIAGNITQFDVMGARLYSRPLSFLDVPVISELQVGGSYAGDRDPSTLDNFVEDEFGETPEAVHMFGADMLLPLLSFPVFTMDFFGDFAFQSRPVVDDKLARAFRTGARGRIVDVVTYTLDLTFPYNGYVPYYFSRDYDLNRKALYESDGLDLGEVDGRYFLRGSAGVDLFQENFIFDLTVSGQVGEGFSIYEPSMTAELSVGEELIPFFFFDASYTKNFIEEDEQITFDKFIDGVMSPTENSQIRVDGNIRYGLLLTRIGANIEFDEDGERTTSYTVAGDIQLDGLFGFLQ